MNDGDDEHAAAIHSRAVGREEQRRSASPTVAPLRLLYVDARKRRREALAAHLEGDRPPVEFDVTAVPDNDTALECLGTLPVDCILGTSQTEGGGLALIRQVREAECDLPFVLITDEGSEEFASEAVRAGVTDYVPYDGSVTAVDALPDRILDAVDRQPGCVPVDRLDGIEEAVEHAADAIVVTDSDGTIEYVNPAFEEITGYGRAEALDRNPRILKSGKQDETYYEELWETILDGEVWEEEITNETKDGDHYIAHQTIAPVVDDQGAVRKFIGIQRDVTRQRHLEEQVDRAATTLSRVYTVTSDADLSLRTKIDAVLEIACRHLDFPVGYVTRIDEETQHVVAAAGDHDEIQPDASDPLGRTYCRQTVARQKPVVLADAVEEGWEDDPAYERFGLRCYLGARVDVGGEPYGTLCFGAEEPKDELAVESQRSTVRTLAKWVGYEIERHRYEKQLERQNERLDEFAALVSHDLRNPLTVAKARVDVARETGDDGHLDAVSAAHERMEAIIDDTLTLARQGDLVETTTTFSLATLANDCWDAVRTDGATLRVVGDCELRGDPDRVRHLLENLFRNAVEHGSTGNRPEADDAVEHGSTSPRSSPTPDDAVEHGSTSPRSSPTPDDAVEHGSTSPRSSPTPDDAVEHGRKRITVEVGPMPSGFYVADDGPGIDPEERDRIFERGYSSGTGTGFGLSIVGTIVDAHGWAVSVTDSAAGGARFEFETAAADADQGETILPHTPQPTD